MIRASMDMKDRRRPTLVATLGLYGIGRVIGVQSQSLRRLSTSSVTPTVSGVTVPTMSPTAVMETPSSTSPTTKSTAVTESFCLRLHWQPGYYW